MDKMYQIVCEEKTIRGFGIEYYRLKFVGGVLYKDRESAEKEIENYKKKVNFKDCKFRINSIYKIKD